MNTIKFKTTEHKLLRQLIVVIAFLGIFDCKITDCTAQWSDQNNLFIDSLHMPVCIAPSVQSKAIVIESVPDGGYIIVWEDMRTTLNKRDIYAQKYDKSGKALWDLNGIIVVSGQYDQYYAFSGNDYRNYSHACSDQEGGFYIAFQEDSTSNYYYGRIGVQHIKSDGSASFPGKGYILAETPAGSSTNYKNPQLVSDGKNGFFISYQQYDPGMDYIYLYCFKDENGKLKNYGGGWMNHNAINTKQASPCFEQTLLVESGTTVSDYFIFPDQQGGCNVVMSMNGNNGQQGPFLAFNRLCRVKKDAHVTVNRRQSSLIDYVTRQIFYKKDSVVILHQLTTFFDTKICIGNPNSYSTLSHYIENFGEGFRLLDDDGNNYYYPKGVTMVTPGNINVDVITYNKRSLIGNGLSNPAAIILAYPVENYDSIPYQLGTDLENPYEAIKIIPPPEIVMDSFLQFRDTLFPLSAYPYDNSLNAGKDKLFSTAILSDQALTKRKVYLASYSLIKNGGQYVLQNNSKVKFGTVIGEEISTGFQGNSISYNNPMISTDNQGNALFYIRDYYRAIRISPIVNNTELLWGAMGRAIGTGSFNNGLYAPENPFAILSSDGKGLVSWEDARTLVPASDMNIFTRHLDNLDPAQIKPLPMKPIFPLTRGVVTTAGPSTLLGSSNSFTSIETYSYQSNLATPVMEIQDNSNYGVVSVQIFENRYDVRSYNNWLLLDRNFLVKTENDPKGNGFIVKLFFTEAEFLALKTSNPAIITPDDLTILRQPNATTTCPENYVPVIGEEIVNTFLWQVVPGGYSLEAKLSGPGNIFIMSDKNADPSSVDDGNVGKTYHIYPNPLKDILTVEGLTGAEQLSILDVNGKTLYHINSNEKTIRLQLSTLSPGVYILNLFNNMGTRKIRFAKI